MKEKIYNLSSDICHLSLEDVELLALSSMTNDKYSDAK